VPPIAAPGAPLFPADGVLAKALWNEELLRNDGTRGVHNLPFYQAVIDATLAQVRALP
jgi:hypothetical protein